MDTAAPESSPCRFLPVFLCLRLEACPLQTSGLGMPHPERLAHSLSRTSSATPVRGPSTLSPAHIHLPDRHRPLKSPQTAPLPVAKTVHYGPPANGVPFCVLPLRVSARRDPGASITSPAFLPPPLPHPGCPSHGTVVFLKSRSLPESSVPFQTPGHRHPLRLCPQLQRPRAPSCQSGQQPWDSANATHSLPSRRPCPAEDAPRYLFTRWTRGCQHLCSIFRADSVGSFMLVFCFNRGKIHTL